VASESKSDVSDMMKKTQEIFATVPAMAPQMEQFWKAQDGILEEVEDFSKAWFERRHEAARSALDAVRKANGNGTDPAAAMEAITDWQRHSMERMTEDMRQWMELWSRCAGRMTPAPEDSAAQGAGPARGASKQTAKAQPAKSE